MHFHCSFPAETADGKWAFLTSPDENQPGLLFRGFEGKRAVTRDSRLFHLDGIVCSVYAGSSAPAGTGNVE